VMLGTVIGGFQAAGPFSAGTSRPTGLTVGDFNGDGQQDLAVTSISSANDYLNGDVGVLLGTGNGGFQAALNFSAGLPPRGLAVGDFNGDGHQDIVATNYSGSPTLPGNVTILLGTGTGSFQTLNGPAVGLNPLSVKVGDFDGDGKPDLAVANGGAGRKVSALLWQRTGRFLTTLD